MFKRKNVKAGSRPPTYFSEAEHDSEVYAEPFATSYTIVPSRGPAPSRPPRDGLPRLPPQFENQKLQQARQYAKGFPSVSTSYSQCPPNPPEERGLTDTYRDAGPPRGEYEVSPPSSPEPGALSKTSGHYQSSHGSISPIDESPTMSRVELEQPKRPESRTKTAASSIPILRRERRREQVANAAAKLESKKTTEGRIKQTKDPRWDPYTGEQTMSEKGQPQSMKPKEYGEGNLHSPSGLSFGNLSEVSSQQIAGNQSFGERMRKLKIKTAPAERPEWRGASGRHALISPVSDQSNMPPLSAPRKNSRPSNSGSTTPVHTNRPGNETHYASTPISGGAVDPRSRAGTWDNFHPQSSPPHSAHTAWNARASPVTDSKTQARGHDNPVEVHATFQRDESTTTIERNFHDALRDVKLPSVESAYVQPPSRFSVSTYAPSMYSTPRPSFDSHSSPPMQQGQFHSTSPILNRRHPKYESPASSKATTRKAVATNSPIRINLRSDMYHTIPPTPPSATMPHTRLLSLASDMAKTLPPSPAEASSVDLISALEAQRDDLSHRRQNIERSIRRLTELMPTDLIVVTDEVRRKREDEKRKVEGLRKEEADLRRCEHDVGLRLHRAWKRREREDAWESTGLWVRRVGEK